MGEAVTLLLLCVLVLLPEVQPQPQPLEELTKEGIRCIRDSREETALGRWLHCLSSSSQYQQDFKLPAGDLESGENSQIELSVADEEVTAENSAVDEEFAQIEQRTLGTEELQAEGELPLINCAQEKAGRIIASEPLGTDMGDEEKSSSIHFGTEETAENSAEVEEIAQIEQRALGTGELQAEGELPLIKGVLEKAGRIMVSEQLEMDMGDEEKSSSIHYVTEEFRAMRDEILLFWLKLNLAVFTFGKLLFSLIGRCNWRNSSSKSSEPSNTSLSEDDREAVPEISKSVIIDDGHSSSRSMFESAARLHTIGSSLGSAVGAVFGEVLLRTGNSGPSVPSDKISLLLDSALKELLVTVEGDDGCSELVANFLTSFKSTYATMCRIQQACTSYEGSRERDSPSVRDNLFRVAMCESCRSVKSNNEMRYASKTDFSEDIWQGKQDVPSASSMVNSEKEKLVAGMDVISEQEESLIPAAACEKYDTGTLATSSVEEIPDLVSAPGFKTHVKPELDCEGHAYPSCASNDDDFKYPSIKKNAELVEEGATQLEYEVDDASSACEDLPSMVPRLEALTLMVQSYPSEGSEFQRDFLKMYERCVQAQERHNQIKYVKFKHSMKQQSLEEEKIQLSIVANGLMRENIDLDRTKVTFKENRALEEQEKAAYVSFSTTCADELAAGLLVMLATLMYSVRKYSFALLSDLVSTCQPSAKEPRRSVGFRIDWFYNSLDSMAEKLQAFVCHVSVTGRISFGLILVAIVTSSLLRRSVTSSSQAMPATILIVVLGGVCGFVGKVSVDSLGGSGNQWWVVWGVFCGLHAVTTCFGASVCRLLSGSPASLKARFGLPFWLRRFAFHMTLVFVLPVLAGLLPFGSLRLVMNDLFVTMAEIFASGFASFYEWPVDVA